MLLGYSSWGMPHIPYDQTIEHCARLGYDSLELTVSDGWSTEAAKLDASDRRRIRELFDRNEIELSGLIGNTPVLAGSEREWQRSLRLLESYFELAADLQRDGESLPVSCISYGAVGSWERDRDLAAELLRAGGGAGGGAGRRARRRAARDVRAAHARGREVAGRDGRLAGAADRARHQPLQRAGDRPGPRRRAAGAADRLQPRQGRARQLPGLRLPRPGRGRMDYVGFLRAMERAGYRGAVAVEISPFVQRRLGFDALAVARRSYEVVAAEWEKAGVARRAKPVTA